MTVSLKLLGTVAVMRDGVEVGLGPQRRLLLALLASRRPHAIHAEELIDQLWDGDAPSSAATAIRVHLTYIRKALDDPEPGGQRDSINYAAGHYRLAFPASGIDAAVHIDTAAAVAKAVAAGDFDTAIDLGYSAAGDGRPAFGTWASHHSLLAEAARIDGIQRGLVGDVAVALIGRRRPHEALTLVRSAAVSDPYDERVAAVTVASMAAAGNPTEALRFAEGIRRLLAEEVGALPGPLLRSTVAAVLDGEDPVPLLLPDQRVAAVPSAPERSAFVHPLTRERFVGRGDALSAAAAAIEDATDVLVVTGEIGIGKSAFAATVAGRSGRRVLHAMCDPDESRPLEPLRRALAEETFDDPLLQQWAKGSLDGRGDSTDLSQSLIDRLVADLESRHRREPMMLLVDDMQWADDETLQCCRRLAARHHVTQVVTSRTVAGQDGDGFLHSLSAAVRSTTWRLGPLSPSECDELAGEHASEALRHACGGNPYLLRLLVDSAIALSDPSIVDLTVQSAVKRLLGGVAPDVMSFLQAAAVSGPTFSSDRLVDAGLVDRVETAELLDRAAARGVIVAAAAGLDRWTFRHGAVRDELRQSIAPQRRRAMHLALAATYARGDARFAHDRARHLLRARPLAADAEVAEAVGLAVAAAIGNGSPSEAAHLLDDFGVVPDDPLVVAHVELAKGRLGAVTGPIEAARHRLSRSAVAAGIAGRADLTAAAIAEFVGPWIRRWQTDQHVLDVVEHARRTVQALGDQASLARLDAASARAKFFGPDRRGAVDCAERALAAARQCGDADVLVESLRASLLVTAGPVGAFGRRALAEEALLLAANRSTMPRLLSSVASARLAVGDIVGANEAIDTLASHGDRWSSALAQWEACVLQTAIAIGVGDASFVRAATTRSAQLGPRAGVAEADATAQTQRFVMRWWSGRLAGTSSMLGELAKVAPAPIWRSAHLLACLADGDEATAQRLLPSIVDELGGPRDYLWTAAAVFCSRAVSILEDRSAAEMLFEMFGECDAVLALLGDATAVLGPLDRWRASLARTLGRDELAGRLLASAHDVAVQTGMQAWAPDGNPR